MLIVIVHLFLTFANAWDPDAGLVASYSKAPNVVITASSNSSNAYRTVDKDAYTPWTSEGCLPDLYFRNPETNVLKDACSKSGLCTTSGVSSPQDLTVATDGDDHTNVALNIDTDATQPAVLNIQLPRSQQLYFITFNAKFYPSNLTLLRLYDDNDNVLYTFSDLKSLASSPLHVPVNQTVSRIAIDFDFSLTVYEIAAIGENGCLESVTWDLGGTKEVGVIKSKHWAGDHGLRTQIFMSSDGLSWNHVAQLNPDAQNTVTTVLPVPVQAQYIKMTQQQNYENYAEVYIWEVDVYDQFGEYGPSPGPQPNPATLREMLGVNAIWGWGNAISSTLLAAGQGAFLYSPVATHARSYHNMDWDVTDPDVSANYEQMAAGLGTESKTWVNWDTEYALWHQANLTVHVSLQFKASDFPPEVWNNPNASAFRYGEEFAQHFGPSKGTGAAKIAEVGNEPWDFEASFYRNILRHMALGLKAGDPALLVTSGAFQADDDTDQGNYIGTKITEDVAPLIDVINFHHYSFLYRPDGIRVTTHPENPASVFNTLKNMLRWRDTNMPSTPVWVTEWGWDSAGAGEDCQFPECVSETAASVYATRGLLIHARYGIQRSTWFFYGNTDCDSHVFCRCGLTGSIDVGFGIKGPFKGLQGLLDVMGHTGFLGILQEDSKAYVYTFGRIDEVTGENIITHIVGWRPVDIDVDTNSTFVAYPITVIPEEAFCQDDTGFTACPDKLPPYPFASGLFLTLTPSPIVVRVQEIKLDSVIVGR